MKTMSAAALVLLAFTAPATAQYYCPPPIGGPIGAILDIFAPLPPPCYYPPGPGYGYYDDDDDDYAPPPNYYVPPQPQPQRSPAVRARPDLGGPFTRDREDEELRR